MRRMVVVRWRNSLTRWKRHLKLYDDDKEERDLKPGSIPILLFLAHRLGTPARQSALRPFPGDSDNSSSSLWVKFASRGSMNHAAGAGRGWHPTATTLDWGGKDFRQPNAWRSLLLGHDPQDA
ncbi:protein of unknown function [Pseudomonas sp. JV241A]|nr:protein of unknown function [Pseudomonas sp. JV241A]